MRLRGHFVDDGSDEENGRSPIQHAHEPHIWRAFAQRTAPLAAMVSSLRRGPLIQERHLAELLLSTRGAQQRVWSPSHAAKVAAFQGLSCRRRCNKCRSRDRPNPGRHQPLGFCNMALELLFGAIPARTGRAFGGERLDCVSEVLVDRLLKAHDLITGPWLRSRRSH